MTRDKLLGMHINIKIWWNVALIIIVCLTKQNKKGIEKERRYSYNPFSYFFGNNFRSIK